ncbi:MAG: carboxypeptidase regulatory-like domain-containing protein [Gemmatimonadaceae bacterium]
MHHRAAALARVGAATWLWLSPTPAALNAQDRGGVVRGQVVDSAGAPVADAHVSIAQARRLTRTDSAGTFQIARLSDDSVEVLVRRIGYKPRKVIAFPHDATGRLRVVLEQDPALLEGVEVTAEVERLRTGIEDFYRRQALGVGTYFTRADFVSHNTLRASDVLRNAPGIRFIRIAGGMGIRFNSSAIIRRDCTPMIWLDGQRAPGLEIDDVPASDIEGIELYKGPSTTPMQFSQYSSSSTCGTIVIWTRIPGS